MSRWAQASETELLAALVPAQQAMNAAHREMLELVAEISARHAGTGAGYRSEAELLHLTCRVPRSVARARIDAVEDVLPRVAVTGQTLPPALPATAVAVAEDAISAEHVAAIRAVLASLPAHLSAHHDGLESDLAGWARDLDPWTVRTLGRRALEYLDPGGPAPRDTDPASTRLSLTPQGTGYLVGGWLDREAHATLMSALSPLTAPTSVGPDGTPDSRSTAERQGAGLVELARRALDAGRLPTECGQKPHVIVTIDLDDLESATGTGLLDFGDGTLAGIIAAEDARRLACDARRSWIRLDADGLPLDVGRDHYVVPRHIRRALHQRDHGCAFPGCTVPPQWTDAHHVVHWADHGVTALHNLVLLCGHHHRMLHRSEWSVTVTGGIPIFHPPPWQQRPPLTNPLHRPDRAGHRTRERKRPPHVADLSCLGRQ